MKKKFISLAMVIIVTFASLVGCGGNNLPVAKGYQWKVSKGDKEIYLVGTIHLTNPKYSYLHEEIEKALENADGLAVEVDITNKDIEQVAIEYQLYKNGETIENYLTSEEITKLKDLSTALGLNYEMVKMFKPAAIISSFESLYYTKNGNNGDALDSQMIEYMKKNNKEIVELETAQFQFEMLEELYGMDVFKEFLAVVAPEEYLKDEEVLNTLKETTESYINGKGDYFEEEIIEMKSQDENYYNLMLKNRNEVMVEGIERLFEKEGNYVIAVGSLHYFGEDGIVKMLEGKGYTVTPVK